MEPAEPASRADWSCSTNSGELDFRWLIPTRPLLARLKRLERRIVRFFDAPGVQWRQKPPTCRLRCASSEARPPVDFVTSAPEATRAPSS